MDLVLLTPEIPHNTGCAARLAAATGLRLHLVEPLGFSLEDRYLKRAGLDYWPQVDLVLHTDWEACAAALQRESARSLDERLRLFTARGGHSLFAASFEADNILAFGCETKGLPASLLAAHPTQHIYIPIQSGVRSLNLANVVALGAYTALDRAGVPLPDNDGTYTPHARGEDDVRPQHVARTLDRGTPDTPNA